MSFSSSNVSGFYNKKEKQNYKFNITNPVDINKDSTLIFNALSTFKNATNGWCVMFKFYLQICKKFCSNNYDLIIGAYATINKTESGLVAKLELKFMPYTLMSFKRPNKRLYLKMLSHLWEIPVHVTLQQTYKRDNILNISPWSVLYNISITLVLLLK